MSFEVYQILVPIISIVAITMTFKSHLNGDNTMFETFFWIIFWLGISLIALFPDFTTNYLSQLLGIKDNVNAVIFIGLAASFFIHFRTFHIIKLQNKTITELVRKIALELDREKKN